MALRSDGRNIGQLLVKGKADVGRLPVRIGERAYKPEEEFLAGLSRFVMPCLGRRGIAKSLFPLVSGGSDVSICL
jgi:hypothetical protein